MSPKNNFYEKEITLIVSKEEASDKIKNRIVLGKKMLESPINSEEEIEELDNKIDIWTDFNIELLKKLFSDDSISKEYQSTCGAMRAVPYDSSGRGSGLRVIVENLENNLKAKINKLESIFDRLELFSDKSKNQFDKLVDLNIFWDLLHPKIVEVSKNRFETKHFADSVEAALKEVDNIVKALVKQITGQEHVGGAGLMHEAFSVNKPIIILGDLSTQTGKDIQQGYMEIFAGSMSGIRNPKAHDNINIDDKRAIHFLFLASLLMFKIDERK